MRPSWKLPTGETKAGSGAFGEPLRTDFGPKRFFYGSSLLDVGDNVPQLLRGDVRQTLATTIELLVDFEGNFLHVAVHLLRATRQ